LQIYAESPGNILFLVQKQYPAEYPPSEKCFPDMHQEMHGMIVETASGKLMGDNFFLLYCNSISPCPSYRIKTRIVFFGRYRAT